MDNLTVWALAIPVVWWLLLWIWDNRPRGFVATRENFPPTTQAMLNTKVVEIENRLALIRATGATTHKETMPIKAQQKK